MYTGAGLEAVKDEEEGSSARVDDAPFANEGVDSMLVSETAVLVSKDEVVDWSLTGQTVVYIGTSSVVTEPIFEEHSIAPGAQELTVYTLLV